MLLSNKLSKISVKGDIKASEDRLSQKNFKHKEVNGDQEEIINVLLFWNGISSSLKKSDTNGPDDTWETLGM